MLAGVRSETMAAKVNTNARTTIAIQALVIETKRKRITGTKRIDTAKKMDRSRAARLMRAPEKNSI